MPITKDVSNTIIYAAAKDTWESDLTGVVVGSQFTIAGENDVLKQAQFSTEDLSTNTRVVLKVPGSSGTLALSGGGGGASFITIQTPSGTSPVATGPSDTLTLIAGANMTITGDATTDSITFAATGGGGSGITALTGDVTASGTGSVAATLATVNSNVGSFTSANITVNAKGLITAAANGSGGGVPTLTANRSVISDGSGGLTTSTVTTTEVSYLSGVTSAIQTQIAGLATSMDVQIFTVSATWTKPGGNPKKVTAYVQGAGGGAGSGRKVAVGSIGTGGGGGGGGGFIRAELLPSSLGATEAVTVGTGGTGGVSVTVNSTNGNPGLAGGISFFNILRGNGGGLGGGGSLGVAGTAGSAGGLTSSYSSVGGAGAASAAAGTAGVAGVSTNYSATGGASGAGLTAAPAAAAGSFGGALGTILFTNTIAGGTSGAIGTNGNPGNTTILVMGTGPGTGGGSGGSSIVGNAGSGGAGAVGGAGGGGGGAAQDAVGNSGAGGDGGRGWVVVVTEY